MGIEDTEVKLLLILWLGMKLFDNQSTQNITITSKKKFFLIETIVNSVSEKSRQV